MSSSRACTIRQGAGDLIADALKVAAQPVHLEQRAERQAVQGAFDEAFGRAGHPLTQSLVLETVGIGLGEADPAYAGQIGDGLDEPGALHPALHVPAIVFEGHRIDGDGADVGAQSGQFQAQRAAHADAGDMDLVDLMAEGVVRGDDGSQPVPPGGGEQRRLIRAVTG
jgi:hypothetical protein